jgi:hypothetical protein
MMTSEDVGKVFKKSDGTYWVMCSYLSGPGVSFQRVDTGEKTIMVGASSLIAQEYSRMVLPVEVEELFNMMSQREGHRATSEG